MAESQVQTASPGAEKIYECQFEIRAEMPQALLGKFTEKHAKLLGVHGWIEKVEDGVYRGHLEGDYDTLAKIRQLYEMADIWVEYVKHVAFTQIREIEKFTQQNFERRF